MCTVTWRGSGCGYDLFFNRDERRDRPAAEPTSRAEAGGVSYLAPTDPVAGGTWLVANEWGLVVGLLNAYATVDRGEAERLRIGQRSRGELVRGLAGSKSLTEVAKALHGQELTPYPPFTLAVFEPDRWSEHGSQQEAHCGPAVSVYDWDGASLVRRSLDPQPILSSSSYRSEAVVAARRGALAARGTARPSDPDTKSALAFHRLHLDAGRTMSPCMHRDHSVTVSLSWIRVGAGRVEYRYAEGPPCAEHPFAVMTIPLVGEACAAIARNR